MDPVSDSLPYLERLGEVSGLEGRFPKVCPPTDIISTLPVSTDGGVIILIHPFSLFPICDETTEANVNSFFHSGQRLSVPASLFGSATLMSKPNPAIVGTFLQLWHCCAFEKKDRNKSTTNKYSPVLVATIFTISQIQ